MEKRVNKHWQWHTLGPWMRLLTEWSRDSLGGTCSLSPFLPLSVHDSSRIRWIGSQSLSKVLEAVRGTCRYLLLPLFRFISLERLLFVSLDRRFAWFMNFSEPSIAFRYQRNTRLLRSVVRKSASRGEKAFDIAIAIHEYYENRSRSECRDESSAVSRSSIGCITIHARQCCIDRIVSSVVILRYKWVTLHRSSLFRMYIPVHSQ